MCQLYQFARNKHEAWLIYFTLEQQARFNPELMKDRDYLDRRIAAKDRYFTLARRKG